jgi:hypothetical protein
VRDSTAVELTPSAVSVGSCGNVLTCFAGWLRSPRLIRRRHDLHEITRDVSGASTCSVADRLVTLSISHTSVGPADSGKNRRPFRRIAGLAFSLMTTVMCRSDTPYHGEVASVLGTEVR